LPDRAAPDALAKAAPAREESRARAAPQPPAAVAEAPPAPAAVAPSATPAPQAALPAPASLAAGLPWTQVRIEANGRSVVVPRPQAGQLPALVTSMLASTSDDARAGGGASLRLELAQGDEALGTLDLMGESWRWTPMRDAGPTRLLRADPAVASSLREEAQRLLGR
jgi:hypothetical protein